ncbi:ABC transporter ATP-binding protein [Leifsonia shinshuensis]|uniref:ABC-type quaternary amine transporter n=1 Tax=Leifsonia shinshuensis TaxID=150026 RepID=A0A853CQQ5_9MICO|nr:ABC transporter ATP-binding protein [Leifsonia shinshuensis]NYJ22752.1 putative spermidine/putrescine transport system ATP-binding protein [Leifsonia shinshuensis]
MSSPTPVGAADPADRADDGGLRLTALRKTLGGRTIIDDLDLTVQRGELVSLLGPSGCGKTTTLRMIAGFLAPDAGRITMAGRDVTRLGPDKRPSAMVFQNYALWPHMTVAKNVAYPLRLRRKSRAEIAERVEQVLGLVNLLHHRGSRPPQISGGEQQRVALARALVQEPDVLLLDEPLSNLDAKLRVKVREDIRDLQQRLGITTVIVTHDQEEALSISDRVAVMNQGRIEQFTTPAELYARPETEFVATFIGSLNRFDGAFDGVRIVDGDGVVGVRPESVAFTTTPRPGALRATVERIVPHGHFHELRLRRDDVTLAAYVSGPPPALGAVGFAAIEAALVYRDGRLVRQPEAVVA